MIASRPTAAQAGPSPDLVLRVAAGRPVVPVWRNEIGGVTWQIDDGPGREFLKVGPAHPEFDVASDIARLSWLAPHVPVPAVLGGGAQDGTVWLHTAGLPGRSAADPALAAQPPQTARALGRALRRFHDAVPAQDCPFTWSVQDRGGPLPGRPVPDLDAVVCHGDACTPNTLLTPGPGGRGTPDQAELTMECAARSR